ncbi:MAG: hypothetical protein GY854_24905 [Deltaproteobacteria bacterium]|nr:hypothetical protein [Deltaproteobacteria bacterium]
MPDAWTYIVEEPRRTELLRDFGLTDLVISLGGGGEIPDEIFDYYCVKPSHSLDDENQAGSELVVGVFESRHGDCYGVRKRGDGVEFVYFHVKKTEDLVVIGSLEKSLLGLLFEEIADSAFHTRDELSRAANAIGFKYLDEVLEYVFSEREIILKGNRQRDMKAYFKRRLAFVRDLSNRNE